MVEAIAATKLGLTQENKHLPSYFLHTLLKNVCLALPIFRESLSVAVLIVKCPNICIYSWTEALDFLTRFHYLMIAVSAAAKVASTKYENFNSVKLME